MRIALIVWDLSISGGTQRQALELGRYLQRRGHEVVVYCAYINRIKCYPDLLKELTVVAVHQKDYSAARDGVRSWIRYPAEPLFTAEERTLAENMGKGFDIVNPHDFQAYRVAYYYKRLHGAPAVWMVNDLPRSMIPPKGGLGVRKVLDVLHYLVLGGPLGYLADRRRIRALDGAVVFDRPSMEAFRNRTGVTPSRMGSGLDPSSFDFVPGDGCGDKDGFTILAVGIFFPHRRFEDLVRAVGILKKKDAKAKVLLVGSEVYDKAYASRIRSLVSSLGLEDDISFLGEISERELRALYSSSDLLVFPNSPQTWGLAVFEAMASGTPVVVSKGAGASEMLSDGDNALLVPPGDPAAIARAIDRLRKNRELYIKLSWAGRKFVEDSISWEAYGARMESLFLDAVSRQKSSGVRKA